MNYQLMDNIVRHIMSNFLVIDSNFVDSKGTQSLINDKFKLEEGISFSFDENSKVANVWGCQLSLDHKNMKILLCDCSQDDFIEYCLIVNLDDAPTYGIYLSLEDDSSLIGVSLTGNDWMDCNTYLQATFLAGMESIKELNLEWNKCKDYLDQYNLMKSFIEYHDDYYDLGD